MMFTLTIDPESEATVCADCMMVPEECECAHGCCDECEGRGVVVGYYGDASYDEPCTCARGQALAPDEIEYLQRGRNAAYRFGGRQW